MIMLIIVTAIFLALALLAVPIAVATGIASFAATTFWDVPGFIFPQKTINGIESFPLLAIPFFILAAAIMNAGGVTPRIIDVISGLLGRTRGSSGAVNVGTNVFLAGISGSSVADAAATGGLIIPEMKKEGYSGAFAAALTAGAAVLGVIIPPSIALIVYGVIAQVSIMKLFIGAYLPGLIIAACMFAYVSYVARRADLPARGRTSWRQMGQKLRVGFWAMTMPVLIIIGAKGGMFTVTELGAVLVVYAIFISWVIHREFQWKEFPDLLTDASLQTANIMLIVGISSFIAYLVVINGAPAEIKKMLADYSVGPITFLLIVNAVFLVAGMFLDSTPATIILVPIFLPAAIGYGIDPVHFGLIVVLNLGIGLITPPVGLNLFITQSIARVPMKLVIWEIFPIIGILLFCLAVVTYIPQTVLWLPRVLGLP